MTDSRTISALDLHGALSNLLFAIKEELGPGVDVRLSYSDGLYLEAIVSCRPHKRQSVVDQLTHGVLWGPYDYRFKGVAYPTMPVDPWDWIELRAIVDLHASKPPSGRVDYENTPTRMRERQERYGWGYR